MKRVGSELKKNPLVKWLVLILMAIPIFYFILFYPISYYIERPGDALALNSVVEVDGTFSEEPGSYMMTTVAVAQATPLTYFLGFLPHHDILPERALLGDIEDRDTYRQIQHYHMQNSIHDAMIVAFDAAGAEYELEYNGVYVMNVLESSDFADELVMGDTIVELDGQRFESSEEFIDYVATQEVGQSIDLVYERDGEEFEASGELVLIEATGNPGIGISLVDNTSLRTDHEITVHSGNIGGPSAGLMFSLQLYELVTGESLRDGHHIAGTGTISEDGSVGRIGGVDKKVVVADREGASVFFVPEDHPDEDILAVNPNYRSNYEIALETAEEIGTDMEIVPINHFQEAVDYLETLEPIETSQENAFNSFLLAS